MCSNKENTPLHPDFVAMCDTLGDVAGGLCDTLTDTPPETSVRLSRAKGGHISFDGEQVPWCPLGRYLDQRPQFTLDPALHAGAYYVQDASSMFISHVIGHLTRHIDHPVAYLDACAAPGGKTTAAIDALPDGSLVIANEWDYKRAAILRENIIKWGHPAVMVTRGDLSRYRRLTETFDIVAADVPCSGEGMMRKDIVARRQWSPALVRECVERQDEIIDTLVPLIKPGGYLIYSTCTFNVDENERRVERIIRDWQLQPVEIPVDPSWNIVGAIGSDLPCYRFIPGRTRGEGLFMAVLRVPGESTRANKKSGNQTVKATKIPAEATNLIKQDCRADYMLSTSSQGIITARPAGWHSLMSHIAASGPEVILDGVEVAAVKGRDIIPAHSLAMSPLLTDKLTRVPLDRHDALVYLRRNPIALPEGVSRGYVAVTDATTGLTLGLVKNLGNRSNNLYPPEWRIRTL